MGTLSDVRRASPFLRGRLGTIGAGREPLLGQPLGLPVQGRDDRVATGLDGGLVAQDRHQLTADLPGEVGRLEHERLVTGEDDRLRLGRRDLGRGQAGPASAALAQPVEDPVAPDHGR